MTKLYVASSLLLLLLLLCNKAVRACDKVVCDNVLCACDGVVCDRAKAQNGKTKAPHNYGGKRTIGFDIDNIFVNERGSPSPCHSRGPRPKYHFQVLNRGLVVGKISR